jgi:aspartyl-tRNA(Asn)/glutamyl-tRNA(Gln) amidotransferase subunit A
MAELQGRSAAALGREIEVGALDPVELTEAALAAIAEHPFGRRIFARTTQARARAEAAAARARARRGLRRSPLDGVPISWKDLFDTAGIATEGGSALLRGRTPERDAEVLANATAAGLVCLGKTHMTELAFSGLGLNPITESPPCVNDHEAISGGSSSGAAASVAFGLAAAGIGSDTGGSVRVPAAWNDLVGLKTSAGRLPLAGTIPLAARFDTIGPLTRTVEDAALLLAALGGWRPADLAGASPRGLRLLDLASTVREDVEGAPERAHDAALGRLRASGVHVAEGEVPAVDEAMGLAGILFTSETYGTWADTIEADPDAMFPPILERFRAGRAHGAADYVAAWHRLDALRAIYAEATAGYDAVLCPSVAYAPPKQAMLLADHPLFSAMNLLALRNTRVANLMGLCALTLPTDTPSCGLMLMAPAGAEERLLRLGAALEPLVAGAAATA